MTLSRRSLARGLAAAPLAYAAIRTGSTFGVAAQDGPVKIGSKNFTEQLILGEMYALLLEKAGIATEKKLNLAGTEVAQAALVKGEIDLYPEYTGTGLTVILGMPVNEVMQATPVGGMPEATPVGAEADLDQRVYDLVRLGRLHEFNPYITAQGEKDGAGFFPVSDEAFANNPNMEQTYYWQFNQ